jgi:ATP-binding cassette subfamily B multidrug efflux pump
MKQLKTLLPFLKQHSLELFAGFLFMLLQNYSYMKTPAYMQKALDEITRQNRLEHILSDLLMIVVYTGLTVVSMFLMRKLMIGVSRKIEYTLRETLYQKLLALDMEFFQKNETGDLVSRCTNDLGEVRQLLGPGIMYIPNSLSRLLLFIPVLIQLSLRLMLMVTALMVVLVVFITMVMPRLRPLFRKIQEIVGMINSRVWQVISGISTIKLYTLEAIEIERFKTLNTDYIRRNMAIVKYRDLLWPLFLFLFSLIELIVLIVGGKQVIQHEMTIGQLLQFTVMVAQLTFPVLSLGWIMSMIQQGISAMGRINYILDHPVEQRADWKILDAEELTFTAKNLEYQYPNQQGQALHQIDLTIAPGQVIGVTGIIGSGKTTLLNLMTGLSKPEPGMLVVNGIDIRDIHPESLFAKISVVSQEPFLFSRSIAENITLGTDGTVDRDEIKEAVRQAGLERDVMTFPNQYDQIIGERGITLSGGQKQRMAIARALRKRSPVLVFDDALSSVDAKTEAEILDSLKALDSFKTLIIVSHRISALKNADKIYVLDQGTIVEQGTHVELLQHGKLYARLAKLQQLEMEITDG